jgi:hypothetical protein
MCESRVMSPVAQAGSKNAKTVSTYWDCRSRLRLRGAYGGDYVGPRIREKTLRQKARCRNSWAGRKWRVSAKGNSYLNAEGFNIIFLREATAMVAIGVSKSKIGQRGGSNFAAAISNGRSGEECHARRIDMGEGMIRSFIDRRAASSGATAL